MNPNVSKQPTKILIVDDHPAIREALIARIGQESHLEVCGQAADKREALSQFVQVQPDLVIVDISLKLDNGIDLIKRIKDRNAEALILVWSMHDESHYAERALRAGANGYINKDQATDSIIDAINQLLDGKMYFSDAISKKLLHRLSAAAKGNEDRTPLDELTEKEFDVFQKIGQGIKTVEIAKQLHLGVKTVETYRDRIRRKLALKDGTDLTYYAIRWMLQENQEF